MKIAIVSLDNSEKILSGGKHVHQQLLENGLKNLGHDVSHFFPRRTYWYLFVRVMMAVFRRMKLSNKAKAYKWTLEYFENDLVSQLKDKKFDVVFSQDPVSAVAARNALPGTVLMTLHGYLSLESINYGYFDEGEKEQVINVARIYERDSLKAANQVIAVDSKISKYLQQEFNYQKPVTVLKNAINPGQFNRLTTEDKNSLKSELKIKPSQKIILVPRRLVKKNGVHVALKALAELPKLDLMVLVMGEGPELQNLLDLKTELKLSDERIKFLGSINHSEAVKYYDLADIVLVPSVISDGVEEATSLSMLEGMAAKKIVIVSAIGGMKEVIVNRKNGFSFEQNNHLELAQLINEVLSYSTSQLHAVIEQGFKDVCDLHHYQKHAEKYVEVSQRV